jgi:hypothetical protein
LIEVLFAKTILELGCGSVVQCLHEALGSMPNNEKRNTVIRAWDELILEII